MISAFKAILDRIQQLHWLIQQLPWLDPVNSLEMNIEVMIKNDIHVVPKIWIVECFQILLL